jgi:hypothetical protein
MSKIDAQTSTAAQSPVAASTARKHPRQQRVRPTGLAASLKRFPLFHILIFISFFVSGIFINFCQLVLWLTIRPFSLDTFRRVNKYLNYAIWSREYSLFFDVTF